MEVGPGCMVIRARAGQNQLRLMVDTGAPGLMLYEKGFKKKFPNARRLGKRKLSNLGGKKSLKEVQIPPFKLGGEEFGKLKALLIKCPDRQAPAFDGLLGLTSLELARVYFDFNRQMLSYQRRRK